MSDLLLIERAKTAEQLMHAAQCVQHLESKVMPTCEDDRERARVQFAIDNFKDEVRRLGDRMLQLAGSSEPHSSRSL